MTDRIKCTVREGRFVEPCETLTKAIDHGNMSRARGVFRRDLADINTFKPTRSYVGVITKQFKNGLLFNFCPFCGADISAPFQPKDAGAAA